MHASEFLTSAKPLPEVSVLVLFGTERFFKLEVIRRIPDCHDEEGRPTLARFSGSDAEFRQIVSELSTVSMFGDRRIALIEDADEFISANRESLEKYVARPARGSLLILDVKTWAKSTRLYKAVDAGGLALDCGGVRGAALTSWLRGLARAEFQKSLDQSVAALIVQLAGDSAGLLQQEVGKLAALVGDRTTITQEDVVRIVGGWRHETTWVMLDAIRDNRVGTAIEALDKLLLAGEAPMKILGGTVFTFRRLVEATEAARCGTPLDEALRAAGVLPFAVSACEKYLRRIGFDRASRILKWLIEADHDIKGGSRVDHRLLLERLFVRLAGLAPPAS